MAAEGISIESLLGTSQAMERVRSFARKAAAVNVPVLILGETGTGKTLLGKVIHQQSVRGPYPYLAVNCAGIPDTLFESEFFGHQRGAFTGAREARKGILEQARGGSVFLDEVGELSIQQQAKLLTAIEEGEVRRLGGEGAVKVNVRVMAATSRDLSQELREGRFRRDLFHRLAVLICRIPPLRDRPEDISPLARHFLLMYQRRHGRAPVPLSPEVRRYLMASPWPGNVRELAHLLEAALILSEHGKVEMANLEEAAAMKDAGDEAVVRNGRADSHASCRLNEGPRLRSQDCQGKRKRYAFLGSEEEEREVIRRALAGARGNKTRAARQLGMARNTLRMKLRRYGLD